MSAAPTCARSPAFIFLSLVGTHGLNVVFNDNYLTWQHAEEHCQRLGGHLLTITSAEHNKEVFDTWARPNHGAYWIGYNDIESEGNWTWVNPEAASSYTNWASGEPNGGRKDEDCALVGYKYYNPKHERSSRLDADQWVGYSCTHRAQSLCECQDCAASTPPSRLPSPPEPWNSTIRVISEAHTWPDAQYHCKIRYGGNLVTITSPEMGKALYEAYGLGRYRAYWIGLNDRDKEGDWTWISGADSKYINWRPGEPDSYKGRNEDCAMVGAQFYYKKDKAQWGKYSDTWGDARCTRCFMQALCEVPLSPGTEDSSSKGSGKNNKSSSGSGTDSQTVAIVGIVVSIVLAIMFAASMVVVAYKKKFFCFREDGTYSSITVQPLASL